MKKIILFIILFFPLMSYAQNYVTLTINEDGELDYYETYPSGEDINEYIELEDEQLTIKKSAEYQITNYSYDMEVKQTTTDKIVFSIWSDGNLTLNNINSDYGFNITANGELKINNSNILLSGRGYDGSINAEEDIIIDNSTIDCVYDGDYIGEEKEIHSYYGDIYIKSNSKVKVNGRIHVDDGSIFINDSNIILDGIWGYMEAPTDIIIDKSDIKFLFGIQGGEKIEIKDSTINALDKECPYAREYNDNNQGWIQASDGPLSINDSTVNVINSITSVGDLTIKNSHVITNGKYSNNGYLQSGNGDIIINDSDITTDKDIFAENNIAIDNSQIKITGKNSKMGYLEASTGGITAKKSTIVVDEGIISEKDLIIEDSDVQANGTNSGMGYIEVYNGIFNASDSDIKILEYLYNENKTIVNKSNVNIKAGIISKGIEIVDCDFYVSNNSPKEELNSISPFISLDEVLIKNSSFVSESINNVPSIISTGKITIIDNAFINQEGNSLEIITTTATRDNILTNMDTDYFEEGITLYSTALNGKISSYSTLKLKEDVITEDKTKNIEEGKKDENITNPATKDSIVISALLIIISLLTTLYFYKKNKANKKLI